MPGPLSQVTVSTVSASTALDLTSTDRNRWLPVLVNHSERSTVSLSLSAASAAAMRARASAALRGVLGEVALVADGAAQVVALVAERLGLLRAEHRVDLKAVVHGLLVFGEVDAQVVQAVDGRLVRNDDANQRDTVLGAGRLPVRSDHADRWHRVSEARQGAEHQGEWNGEADRQLAAPPSGNDPH